MSDVDPTKAVTIRQHQPHQPGATFRYGMSLILDLHGCNPGTVRYGNGLERFTQQLVEKIDMVAFPISDDEKTWIRHFGHGDPKTAGYTVIQPIETSSITIHLSEGLNSVHADVFSCKEFDPELVVREFVTYFQAAEVIATVLER